jgi:excisionase family DNA binding protein
MSSLNNKDRHKVNQPLGENILTTHELASYLRITEATVCNLAASGELPGFKIGKSWRFDMNEVMCRIASAKKKAKKSV